MAGRSVEAGSAFVRLFVKNGELIKGLAAAKARLNSFANVASVAGGAMMAGGAALGGGVLAGVNAYGAFEDKLLNIQASAGVTAAQLDAIKTAAMKMSEQLGVGPTDAAGGMLELLKAGMDLETVLNGAGQAAIEFARVGELDVATAAVVMSDAMNAFGVDAETAANTISAAADASSDSISGMAQGFSMVSAVASLANQSIEDTSAALALLSNRGIKGSDAGTSLKTMLLSLMAPSETAAGALREIGLSTDALRDSQGKMLPLVQIIARFNKATEGMNQAAKDEAMRKIFGTDAIRAAVVLTGQGVAGFEKMSTAMGSALNVNQKYDAVMSGWTGTVERFKAAMLRVGIAVGEAVAPSLGKLEAKATAAVGWLTSFLQRTEQLPAIIGGSVAALVGIGAALLSLGVAAKVAVVAMAAVQAGVAAMGAVSSVVGFVSSLTAFAAASPVIIGAILGTVAAMGALAAIQVTTGFFDDLLASASATAAYIGGQFGQAWDNVTAVASAAIGGITDALKAGDIKGAVDVAMLGIQAALAAGFVPMVTMWEDFKLGVIETMIGMSVQVREIFLEMMKGLAFRVPGAGLLLNKKIEALEEDMLVASGAVMNTAAQMRREAIGRWQGTADEAITAINAPAMKRTEEAWNEILSGPAPIGTDGAAMVGDLRDSAPTAPAELFEGPASRSTAGRTYGPASPEAGPAAPLFPGDVSQRLLDLPRTLDDFIAQDAARMQAIVPPELRSGGTSGTFSAAGAIALGSGGNAAERTAAGVDKLVKIGEQTLVATKGIGVFGE